MSEYKITRRKFIALVGTASIGFGIAACAPAFVLPTPTAIPAIDNPFARPTFTAVPSSTPPMDIIRNISDKELETFASTTLSRIFETAYNTNHQVLAALKANSPNISWDQTSLNRAYQSFNDQFRNHFEVPQDKLAQAIKTRVEQLREDYKKGIWFYKVWGSPDIERVEFMVYLRAIEEIYKIKGYAVEYDPGENKEPHKMTIYKKGQFDKQEKEMTVLGIPLGRVSRYIVNSDPKNGAVLLDTYPLLGQTHPHGQAYTADGPEYFIHTNQINQLTAKLTTVTKTGKSNDPLENPSDSDGQAKAIRDAAQKILAKIINEGKDIGIINGAIIDLHERGHLLPISLLQTNNESRSYSIQFGSGIDGNPRLSLATMLFILSQQQYLDRVKAGNYYNNGVPAMYPGIPETLDLLIQAITTDLKEDPDIKTKLKLDNFSGNIMRTTDNTLIPNSIYSTEYAVYLLSRLDKLDDKDINKITQKIFNFKQREWFGSNKPVINLNHNMTRRELLVEARKNHGNLLAALLTEG